MSVRPETDQLYYLWPTTSGLTVETDEWCAENTGKGKLVCPECRAVRQGAHVSELRLRYPVKKSNHLGFTGTGIGIMSRELLSVFERHGAGAYLQPGRIYFDGREDIRFVTYHCKDTVMVRGTRNAKTMGREDVNSGRTCDTCGNRYYFGFTPYYIVRAGIRRLVPVMQNQGTSMIVRQEIGEEIVNRNFRGVKHLKIPIVEIPRDGWGYPEF